jgi:hypothetical protein
MGRFQKQMAGPLVHRREAGLIVVGYCPLDLLYILASIYVRIIHILDLIDILGCQR